MQPNIIGLDQVCLGAKNPCSGERHLTDKSELRKNVT